MGVDEDPIVIAKKGLEKAKAEGFTTVIVDTAGRQVIDEPLMKEIKGAWCGVGFCVWFAWIRAHQDVVHRIR